LPDELASKVATDLRIVVGRLVRRLREQASPGDYTAAQKAVLLRLERDGPASVTDLARAEGVRSQSMGATVASLEAAGLIVGAADPDDGRRTVLSLTPACIKLVKATRVAREDWLLRAIDAQLSVDEIRRLAAAVALLQRLADA
jgi:DNA-binding MarR family transcriptional regulator